jgi:predicted Zn-dependent peptidase
LGARITITPQKDALSFAVIAAPDIWEEATEVAIRAIFRATPEEPVVRAERSAIAAELRGRLSNPADAATRELDRAFFGPDHPWGRPTVGYPESIERLDRAAVEAHLRDNFTPDRVFAAVVGPVEEGEVRAHLLNLLGSTFPAAVPMRTFRPAEIPVQRDYNSITTWVAASFRFPETGDKEALQLVGFLASEALAFSPTRRSVYDVSSEVIPRIGGGELRVQVVIPPDEAEAWAETLDEAIARLGTQTLPDDVFENHLRRFRGQHLMRLLSPEQRAHEIARQLLVEGRVVGLMPDLEAMTQDRVNAAARSLGRPTIVRLGPLLN